MKKLLTLSFFVLCFTFTKAQNLVPNPSFEDTIDCPQSLGDYKAANWKVVENTPAYFNACNNSTISNSCSVPQNLMTYRNAATGVAYCGLINFISWAANTREKITAKLIDTLIVGKKYNVSFKITAVSSWRYNFQNGACNKVGILFSKNLYSLSNIAPTNNFCHLKADSIIKDTTGWELISGNFTADSAYSYLTIGNFYDDAHTDTFSFWKSAGSYALRAYSFIDDISVRYDTTQDHKGINEIAETNFLIYPNPADSKLTVDLNHQLFQSLAILDLLGRQIYFDNQLNASKKEIDVSHLQNGFYIIELTTNSNYKLTKKINIIHH